jgi:hypothetical protein
MHVVEPADLATCLIETWAQQGRSGFLLSDPQTAAIETKEALDPSCGVLFRFRWVPHRAIRCDVVELERRGTLNAQRDEARLFRDARDPRGGHCFLCADNIRECYPREVLVPLRLAGREYYAGANFAWIERDHFTVMAAEHTDQAYSQHALQAMLDLHTQTGGRFRVLFNGPGAGASIPWHLHYQITTCPMPIEAMPAGAESRYPIAVYAFSAADSAAEAHACAAEWLARDAPNHSVNILICGAVGDARIFVFPRDQRRATVPGKGLVGGFEVAGDFVLSAPGEEPAFRAASADLARSILTQVRPDV